MLPAIMKLIDIGANLTDQVFRGVYRSRQRHEDDFKAVLERAFTVGLEKIMVTSGSLTDSREAIQLCRTQDRLLCTVGCHPTRCTEFESDPKAYVSGLKDLIVQNKDVVVAVGECGLDYDREQFCPRVVQQCYFETQLQLASQVNLPLFFHCRSAHQDFADIVERARGQYFDPEGACLLGVVHTFDGSWADAKRFIDLGFYLGVNGCSLKTEDNLSVVAQIPLDRLLLETDSPWCEIRPTHAGYKHVKTHFESRKCDRWTPGCLVKGRNEPVNILQVLEVVSSLKALPVEQVAEQVYKNTNKLFNIGST